MLGIGLRCYNLTEAGFRGSDNIYYTNVARAWSSGDFVYRIGRAHYVYRPVVFGLYSLAIKTLGYHDYSIKFLNAGVDSINIVLVLLLAYALSRNLWGALTSAVLYALLPQAIELAREELAHVLSTFTVLLSAIFFVFGLRSTRFSRRAACLLASGLFIALAALTHEELVLLAASYGVFLVLHHVLLTRPPGVTRLISDGGLFILPPTIAAYAIFEHRAEAVQTLVTLAGQGNGHGTWVLVYLGRVVRFAWNLIAGISSPAFFYVFGITSLWTLTRALAARLRGEIDHLQSLVVFPGVVTLTYLLCYAAFLRTTFERLMLPLIPLVIVSVVLWAHGILVSRFGRALLPLTLVLALVLVPFNLGQYRFFQAGDGKEWIQGSANPFEVDLRSGLTRLTQIVTKRTWHRQIYDLMKDKVTSESRLLVTSSIDYPYPGRRIFQVGCYFGDNAIYAIDHSEPLDELIREKKIKYILFTSEKADSRVLQWDTYERYEYGGRWSDQPLVLGALYGFTRGEYTVQREYLYLIAYALRRHARVLHRGSHVIIWQL